MFYTLSRTRLPVRAVAIHQIHQLLVNQKAMASSTVRIGVLTGHLSLRSSLLGSSDQISARLCSTASSPIPRYTTDVLDSFMSYLDTGDAGSKKTVLFLHGNPMSSYLWRNIIPHVQGSARCLAPDLMGMGRSGKIPDGTYRFVDQYRYLDAWIERMNLSHKIVIVCHDWGSALGFHWSHMHPQRIQGIVHMESLVGTVKTWEQFPEGGRKHFKANRTDAGEIVILQKNVMIERVIPSSVMRKLTEEEMDAYREPFKNAGEDRRPMLTWQRQIPIEGDPQDVTEIVDAYCSWLSKSEIPKMYIHADPGFFAPWIKKLCADWPNQKMVTVKGLHFLQEDSPDEIGIAVDDFVREL